MIHCNSIAARNEEAKNLSDIANRIYRFLKHNKGKGYTDKQVARFLNFNHHSKAQPRISELIQKGMLVEGVSQKCEQTGKMVRTVKFNDEEERQLDLI